MSDNPPDPRDLLILAELLRQIERGRDPLITTESAETILPALGSPMTPSQTRSLIVETWTLCGRNVAPASRYIQAARDYIRPREDKPNLKVKAIATARAARRKRPANDGGPSAALVDADVAV